MFQYSIAVNTSSLFTLHSSLFTIHYPFTVRPYNA